MSEGQSYDFDADLASLVPLLPVVDIGDLEGARAATDSYVELMKDQTDRSGLAVSDHAIPRPGAPDVRVRVYAPHPDGTPRAGLLFLHGGGFVLGGLGIQEPLALDLAQQLGVVVVSVDYRLAPEDPYPAALDDCETALHWFHQQAPELDVDTARIGVYGQSAGGNLAAALALVSRDRGGPRLCFQVLDIPALDDRLDTVSMRDFVDTPMWNRPSAVRSWAYYLGTGSAPVSPYAAPARAEDLSGLPAAYVTAMEYDPLRDEVIDYASRMLQAGVHVELHVFPGTFHGCGMYPSRVTKRARIEAHGALRRGLGLDTVPE